MKFANAVTKCRLENGMTKTDFAKVVGIDRAYLTLIEQGKVDVKTMRDSTVARFKKAGVEID